MDGGAGTLKGLRAQRVRKRTIPQMDRFDMRMSMREVSHPQSFPTSVHRSAYNLGKDALADVCGMHLRSREDWHLVNSWFPLHYIHASNMATAFVATEDKTEVLTVVMQAQLLLGYVVWVSEGRVWARARNVRQCCSTTSDQCFCNHGSRLKAFIGRQIEGDVARRSILPQGSEASVDDRESNEGVAESDFDPGADFESDSGSDDSDDSDNGSDDDDDDDGDTQPDGEEVYGFDGVDLDDLDGIKQVQPGTVVLALVESASLYLFDRLGIPSSSSAGFLL